MLAATEKNGDNGNFFEDFGVWKNAPILTGSTKFEPLPGVKNIMITGGAGFMYGPLCAHLFLVLLRDLGLNFRLSKCLLAGATFDHDISECL
jgi:hypothetical protein